MADPFATIADYFLKLIGDTLPEIGLLKEGGPLIVRCKLEFKFTRDELTFVPR